MSISRTNNEENVYLSWSTEVGRMAYMGLENSALGFAVHSLYGSGHAEYANYLLILRGCSALVGLILVYLLYTKSVCATNTMKTNVNMKYLYEHRYLHMTIGCATVLDISLFRYFPWLDSDYAFNAYGLPNPDVFRIVEVTTLIVTSLSVLLLIVCFYSIGASSTPSLPIYFFIIMLKFIVKTNIFMKSVGDTKPTHQNSKKNSNSDITVDNAIEKAKAMEMAEETSRATMAQAMFEDSFDDPARSSAMEDIENPLRIHVSTASSTLNRSIGLPAITQRQDFMDNISNDEIPTRQGEDKVNDNMQKARVNPSHQAIKPKSPFGSLMKSVTKRLSFTKAPKPLSGLETIKKDTEDFDL